MIYDVDEHTRALAANQMALDLHAILMDQADRATNAATKAALTNAADALDIWMHDELTNGVMHVIEAMEDDAGVSEFVREARIMQSAYGRR